MSKIKDMVRKRDPLSEPIEVMQFVAEVGVRIRLMRLARRMSQVELAAQADIGRQTLIAIENGALRTRFADVARLLWALDDASLQAAMATAAQDPVYQEAARAALPRSRQRRRDAP